MPPGFKLMRCALSLAALLLASHAQGAQLLVLEKGSNTLAIIDPHTLQVIARVPAGPDPHEVVASADGSRAYISNYGGEGGDLNFISVVDLQACKPLPPIDLGALHSAHGLDFRGGKLYFTAETNKVIGRYDPVAHRVDWVLGTGQDRTHMIIVGKDLEHLYTSNVSSGTISIIAARMRNPGPPPDAAGRAAAPPAPPPGFGPPKLWEVTNVPAGRGSEGFDLSADEQQIWAANAQDGTITTIDLASRRALETFPVAVRGANRLKFTLDGRYVLVTGLGAFGPVPDPGANSLVVLDRTSHQLLKAFQLGGGAAGILMDPAGGRAFVAVNQADKVEVIDLNTWRPVASIPTQKPDGMAWAQTGTLTSP